MARWKERYHNEPGFKERHKKKVIEQRKNNPNGKESHNASQQKYYRKNHEYILEWIKKYAHSEAGIKIRRRSKNNRRNLGSNELFENIFDEPIVWHHIDDINMVAIPKDIHELHPGNPRERHREYLMPIVKQLYPEIQLLVQ